MDKTQQAAQLRLAADLLETGHPWEHRHISDQTWTVATQNDDVVAFAGNPTRKIRPVLATPPDGRPLHNPDNLTAEQVGVGYRLFCKGENNGQHANQAEMWIGKWVQANDAKGQITTYRVPLSVPWPEAEKPDPYAELKEAHAAGKMIQVRPKVRTKDWHDEWQDCIPTWGDDYEYRIKPTPTFQLPPPPPGMRWHREDGWEEGDLPQGWRPLYDEEEIIQDLDEVRIWAKFELSDGSIPAAKGVWNVNHYRTSRPLTFEHAGKTWTWHRPGDPRPCDGEMRVACVFVDHDVWDDKLLCAHEVNWGNDAGQGCIIGWRYADEKKTVPLGPEDIKPFTVIRRKGEAQTWHWRTVSYVDAVKVTCGNRVYGWDELASSYERNESLPLTGKWNPSAWEPCSKPA